MTHREKVLAALSHQQPDALPIDFGGSRDSSIVVEGYEALKASLGIEAGNELCDRMMRVVQVDERILRRFDISTRAVFPGAASGGRAADLGPGRYRDAWGVERVQPQGSYYYDQVSYPLSGDKSLSDLRTYPWPDADDPAYVKGLRERVQWIRANHDAAAVLTLPAPFVHITQYLRGFEDWYCDLATASSFMETLFDTVLEITMAVARRELEEVGQDVDVVFCADDLGGMDGLLMRPDTYRRHIKPRHQKYFRQIHELSAAHLTFHCCGSVAHIMDDLIEIGVGVLNPVQTNAAGMEPVNLKRKYGARLALWGAMDNHAVLPRGTTADVKRMVEERIEQLGEGGGYVLSPCHNLQPDVPAANIVAMFDHAREYVPSYMK